MICPSCREPVLDRANVYDERLEYVRPKGDKRLRSMTLRVICVDCARSIASVVDAGGDNPAIAAFEVVAKVKDYLAESTDERWAHVAAAMNRYRFAEQKGLF